MSLLVSSDGFHSHTWRGGILSLNSSRDYVDTVLQVWVGLQGLQSYYDLNTTYNDLKAGNDPSFSLIESYISDFFNYIYFSAFTSCNSNENCGHL